jgi:tetratricopeptide (TPR) repeat protein
MPEGIVTEQHFTAREILARHPGLTDDHLRYLRKWGLIQPGVRKGQGTAYSFADLAVIRQVSVGLSGERSFRAIVRGLLAERHGQLALDFQAEATPAKVIRLTPRVPAAAATQSPSAPLGTPPPPSPEAERLFLAASADDTGDPATLSATAARYRKALAIDPDLVPAIINLGNVHYTRGLMPEAQALYERAINLGPGYYEAHFNLGNVLHDTGRLAHAVLSYRDALALHPTCADAHFYLAVTLEKMGRSADARLHWRAYQELEPEGEWADLAREFGE